MIISQSVDTFGAHLILELEKKALLMLHRDVQVTPVYGTQNICEKSCNLWKRQTFSPFVIFDGLLPDYFRSDFRHQKVFFKVFEQNKNVREREREREGVVCVCV